MTKNNTIKTNKQEYGSERNFYPCAIGFAISIGVNNALATLQSSANVKEGIGTHSIMIKTTARIIGSLIAVPLVLERYGQKSAMLFGQIINILFTLANLYPVWYVMYPAAIIAGMAVPCTWVGASVIIQSIASSAERDQNADSSSQKYFGMFLAILSLGQVFTNVMTELILDWNNIARYVDNFVEGGFNHSRTISSYNITSDNLLTCGSMDCPIDYPFRQTSGKFLVLIPDQKLLRVLLTVYILMQIGGAAIHYFFCHGQELCD
uniref:protein unc-93 homolog A-like n=1 Tax=Styela clava TaxID=7725 RepID=UPI0019392DBC|nr:protein unc-93 homolog A-like [Styela clava]